MEGLQSFAVGFEYLIQQPSLWLLIFGGCFFGIVFGAIPGLTGALGVTLLLPFTYSMSSESGLTLLVSVYVGAISGALISATLLNIPGTPASISTTFDGSPMARDGRGGDALLIGTFASLVGGIFSGLCMIFVAPKLARIALIFGSWEYFAMGIMGLCVVVSLCSKDLIKGLMSATVGIILSMVGMDPVSSVRRLTFGNWQLNAGFDTLATLMGLFALAEVLKQLKRFNKETEAVEFKKMSIFPTKKLLQGTGKTFATGSIIGTIIGLLPGVGSATASMVSYTQSQQMSKTPEKFGTGHPEGIVASETANNAVCGGALIPMMALGVPGDLVTAVMLGALVVHGIQPGPQLFTNSGVLVGVIFFVYIMANFAMYILQIGLMRIYVKLLKVPLSYLLPLILLMCMVGSITSNNRIFDAWTLLVVGLVGYILVNCDFSLPPIVLGFILGSLVESNFRTGLISSQGSFLPLFGRPIALLLLAFGILMIVFDGIRKRRKANKKV